MASELTERELLLALEEARIVDFKAAREIESELDRRRRFVDSLERRERQSALAKWRAGREGKGQ